MLRKRKAWKYGKSIIKDLFDAGLRGRLPMFIGSFLKDRQFQVRLGSNLSTLFDPEMGVPQGSILSVTLFPCTESGSTLVFGSLQDLSSYQ